MISLQTEILSKLSDEITAMRAIEENSNSELQKLTRLEADSDDSLVALKSMEILSSNELNKQMNSVFSQLGSPDLTIGDMIEGSAYISGIQISRDETIVRFLDSEKSRHGVQIQFIGASTPSGIGFNGNQQCTATLSEFTGPLFWQVYLCKRDSQGRICASITCNVSTYSRQYCTDVTGVSSRLDVSFNNGTSLNMVMFTLA
jgi:hypothetical protein